MEYYGEIWGVPFLAGDLFPRSNFWVLAVSVALLLIAYPPNHVYGKSGYLNRGIRFWGDTVAAFDKGWRENKMSIENKD